MHEDLKDFIIEKVETVVSAIEEQKKYIEKNATTFKECLDNVFSDLIKPEENDIKTSELKPLKPKLDILAFKSHIYNLLNMDILRLQELINLFKQILEDFKINDFLNVEIIIQEYKDKKCDSEKLRKPDFSELDRAIEVIKKLYKNKDFLKEVYKDLIGMHKDIKQMQYTENYATNLLNEIKFVAKNKKPSLKTLKLIYTYGKKYKMPSKSIIQATSSDVNRDPIFLMPSDDQLTLFNFFEPLIIHEGEFVGYTRLVKSSKNLDDDKIALEANNLLNELFIHFDELLNIYFISSGAYFLKKSKKINPKVNLHSMYELRAYKFELPQKIFSQRIKEGKISYTSKFL